MKMDIIMYPYEFIKYGEFFADKIIGSNGLFEDFELKCSKNDKITL